MSGGEQKKGRPMATKVTFEDAMKRLEEIVRRLEEEKVPLEESIRLYEEGMNAPKVVAKGADFLAIRIRQLAAGSGVPIVERRPLAQALYKNCRIGDEIPVSLYQAVAEVLAYVYELSRTKRIGRPIAAGL